MFVYIAHRSKLLLELASKAAPQPVLYTTTCIQSALANLGSNNPLSSSICPLPTIKPTKAQPSIDSGLQLPFRQYIGPAKQLAIEL